MTKESFASLVEKYPNMFPPSATECGIYCGDGWYTLIDELCSGIQQHVDREHAEQVVVLQIKAKFGGLRFYYRGGDDAIRGMVEAAIKRANSLCDVCGKAGTLSEGETGWLRIRCLAHHVT